MQTILICLSYLDKDQGYEKKKRREKEKRKRKIAMRKKKVQGDSYRDAAIRSCIE